MYRELLSRYLTDNPFAALQSPCPKEALTKAEKAVGYSFPADLKTLLSETNGDRWLLLSAEEIVQNVLSFRNCLAQAPDDEKALWREAAAFLPIATNGCGDYYGYRVFQNVVDQGQLVLWEHESFECRYAADDIADLIEKYYTDRI